MVTLDVDLGDDGQESFSPLLHVDILQSVSINYIVYIFDQEWN
jgi:hypothetical protein